MLSWLRYLPTLPPTGDPASRGRVEPERRARMSARRSCPRNSQPTFAKRRSPSREHRPRDCEQTFPLLTKKLVMRIRPGSMRHGKTAVVGRHAAGHADREIHMVHTGLAGWGAYGWVTDMPAICRNLMTKARGVGRRHAASLAIAGLCRSRYRREQLPVGLRDLVRQEKVMS